VLRYEFTKLGLIKNISAKVAELEKELNDQNELDDRHDAIESKLSAVSTGVALLSSKSKHYHSVAIRRETRERERERDQTLD